MDPELLAAAVGHFKDMMAINEAHRKVAPPIPPKSQDARDVAAPSGKGAGKGKNRKGGKVGDAGAADAAAASQ